MTSQVPGRSPTAGGTGGIVGVGGAGGAVGVASGVVGGAGGTGSGPDPIELDAEDTKLVTLARGARGRAGSPQGAAVRDDDGRTYAAGAVALPSLRLTALQAAVAIAVASGASGLEAAVVIGGQIDDASLSAARELSVQVVILVDDAGVPLARIDS